MKALVIVDMQNDFMPGGPLEVPNAFDLVPVINRLMQKFPLVVVVQDWHLKEHMSFAANHPEKQVGEVVDLGGIEQILWPVHCVQKTRGAELVSGIDKTKIDHIFYKGTDKWIDSYSAFFDNAHRKKTELADYLFEQDVDTICLVGMTTEYGILYSALDALDLGLKVIVVEDGCLGLNRDPDDSEKDRKTLLEQGVKIVLSKDMG